MIAAAAAHWEQEEGRDYAQVEGVFIASLVPMPHHVLVRWLKRTETKGGVLIPQNRQRKSFMKGQILRVGDGCDLGLREGALIQFDSLAEKEWLGVQDPADRDPVFFMREEDIHGVLTYDSERKVHLQPES
jgi:co-chaperonin GroES (HSP10)